ncbi:Uncharacterised protein [Mycobacteroides abscessus subsp. abscessus]|nr:Uncharacterised protein [Mycobacteroides abscessus subsp. abscessus]
MTKVAGWLTRLVVYPFHPANARALASSVRFTLLVAPVSWM